MDGGRKEGQRELTLAPGRPNPDHAKLSITALSKQIHPYKKVKLVKAKKDLETMQ